MISALFKGIFNLISKLFSLLLAGVLSVVISLIPGVDIYFSYITSFLTQALTFVGTILDIFLIPRGALILIFDYLALLSSMYLAVVGTKFVINIYQKFKI